MNLKIKNEQLFNLEHTLLKKDIMLYEYPFEILNNLNEHIIKLGESLDLNEYNLYDKNIWISKTAEVDKLCTIISPTIIGHDCKIRCGAFIRGGVIIGNECVVGNSCEIKNSIIFDNVQIPHFNYVGDSILGYKVHLASGVVLSNLRLDKKMINIKTTNEMLPTYRRKFSCLIGDNCEVGANSVINPGTVIGRECVIYPLKSIKGYIEEGSVVK